MYGEALRSTYRFYRASLAEEELKKYLTSPPARYEMVLALLAIVVGARDVSLEAFAQMKKAVTANATVERFVKELSSREDECVRVDAFRSPNFPLTR